MSFGRQLREYRQRAGLSQEELAERSGVSVRTIRQLESNRVARPRRQSIRLLADALGLAAPEVDAFGTAAERPDRAPGVPWPLSPTIGREEDLHGIMRTFEQGARLITIVGPGGVGKTQLGQIATHALAGRRPVHWVPLTSVTDTALVKDALAEALVGPTEALPEVEREIGDRDLLVTFDNLEHLEDVGSILLGLLAACPRLHILGTTRRPLGVPGEFEWTLRPLAVPDSGVPRDPAALADVPAVRLLVERIQARRPAFRLDADNAADVSRLCRRLDGLPLALDLVASQCRTREPGEVLVGNSGEGPATLDEVIEATCALLSKPARRGLSDLVVFRGGWTRDAASAILGDETAGVLDALVAHGLVIRTDRAGRFTMLETIGHHASGQLPQSSAAQLHAAYFAEFVAKRHDDLTTNASHEVYAALDGERDNIRAALGWLRDHAALDGLRMAIQLHAYWAGRGRITEGLSWYTTLLTDDVLESDLDPKLIAAAANRAGEQAIFTGNRTIARRFIEIAIAASRRTGDDTTMARAYWAGCVLAAFEGRYGDALGAARSAAEHAELAGDQRFLIPTLSAVATVLVNMGRYDEATAAAMRASEIAERLGDGYYAALALNPLGMAARFRGELETADALYAKQLDLLATQGFGEAEAAMTRATRAVLHARLGRLDGARTFVAEASAAASAAEHPLPAATANIAMAEAEIAYAARDTNPPATLADQLIDASQQMTDIGEHLEAIELLSAAAVVLAATDPSGAARLVDTVHSRTKGFGLKPGVETIRRLAVAGKHGCTPPAREP